MSKNLYTLSLDSIKYILGLIRDTVDLPANILDDLHIQSTTTYSSYKLDTLLKALKEENIQYCDEAISKLNKLSKEIITDKLQITNENTIYLLLTDPVDNIYEQWLLINGTPQMIGTTEMKLDSVYTKDEADDRYALLTDFNNLVTSVEKKVDKTDIVDNLTSTDTDKPLSANQGKILNDTKLNKTDANKLNCVSIDNVSLKEYILTNFTEREKTYYLIAKTTCTDLPKASNFYITVETPGLYTYKVTAKELNDSNGRYVCTYRTLSSSWTKWEKVCTTTVADVPFTELMVNNWAKGSVVYTVENGICYLWICGIESSTMDKSSQTIVSNLPRPKRGGLWCNIASSDCTKGGLLVTVSPDGKLENYSGLNNVTYFGTFSYPVAE